MPQNIRWGYEMTNPLFSAVRGFRPLTLLTLTAFVFSTTDCTHWKPMPPTSASIGTQKLQGRKVRFASAQGAVTLAVQNINYPYVFGVPEPGDGIVELDVGTIREGAVLQTLGRAETWRPIPLTEASLIDARSKRVRFTSDAGVVELLVQQVQFPYVRGNPRHTERAGLVRLDLTGVEQMEVHEVDGVRTALLVGAIGGTVLLIAVAGSAAASSNSSRCGCPLVYVDNGQGDELVGKAYAGATFRTMQRTDLVPLIPITTGTFHVRLQGEPAESEYTDRVALVVAEHPSSVRMLSSFDAEPVAVGAPAAPQSARDVLDRDVLNAVSARDGLLWETDLAKAAMLDQPVPDRLEATFLSPGAGQRVLEIVGGNTPWLDFVFSRLVTDTGADFSKYLAILNNSLTAAGVDRWLASEGVKLTVDVLDHGSWRTAAIVPTVGPSVLRELAVPLPAVDASDVTIRLSGGLGFWRIDRLALSRRVDDTVLVRHVDPVAARGPAGADELAQLAAVDGRYSVLDSVRSTLDLTFSVGSPPSHGARTVFLLANGYYTIQPPPQIQTSIQTTNFLNGPGVFSRRSFDLARQYLGVQGAPFRTLP